MKGTVQGKVMDLVMDLGKVMVMGLGKVMVMDLGKEVVMVVVKVREYKLCGLDLKGYSGQVSGGGGSNTGKGKGKDIFDVSELPDPSSGEFEEIDNPTANESREREDDMSQEVREASEQLKKEEWSKYLKQLEMTEIDFDKYEKYKEAVKVEIRELRVTLEGLEAQQSERVWMKNQSTGDIDDNKIIDAITGKTESLSVG